MNKTEILSAAKFINSVLTDMAVFTKDLVELVPDDPNHKAFLTDIETSIGLIAQIKEEIESES